MNPNTDRDERVSDSDDSERLWAALKYRIQAAHKSRSRVKREEHLSQALLYLNALSQPALTAEETELVIGAIPLQSGLLVNTNDAATRMRDRCVEKVREAGQWCDNCPHRAAPANTDGSCSAYGYNGVDCQAQPCRCRSHNPESQHYGLLITALQSLTLEGEQEKQK